MKPASRAKDAAPKDGAANGRVLKPVRDTAAVAGILAANQPVLRHEGVALWRQIASQLQQAIGAGSYAPGARLPTEAELSQHFRVNRHTVRRALEELSRAGLVRVEQGRGSFVAEDVIEYAVEPRTRFSEWIRKHNKEPSGARAAAQRDRCHRAGRGRPRHPRQRARRAAGTPGLRRRPSGLPDLPPLPGGPLPRPAGRAARRQQHHRGAARGGRGRLPAPDQPGQRPPAERRGGRAAAHAAQPPGAGMREHQRRSHRRR